METERPFLEFQDSGQPAILNYNVPQPVCYGLSQTLQIDLPEPYWVPDALSTVGSPYVLNPANTQALKFQLSNAIRQGLVAPVDAGLQVKQVQVALTPEPEASADILEVSASPEIQIADSLVQQISDSKRFPKIKTAASGSKRLHFYTPPENPKPQLMIMEKYKVCSYLGNYGAGRTLSTFSLLPGEESTLQIRTFKQTEEERSSAETIFDSTSDSAVDSFEQSVESEFSNRRNVTNETYVDIQSDLSVDGSITIPIKGIPLKLGVGIDMSSNLTNRLTISREEFSKTISSAVTSHSSSKTNKRDITVNATERYFEKGEEENTITRTVKNVNVSRTLNFAFRQLNQEYIVIKHLMDVQIAFHNGYTYELFSLPEIDDFLEKYIEPANQADVRAAVCSAYQNVFDYQENPHVFVEEKSHPLINCAGDPIGGNFSYMRVKKGITQTYTDTSGNEITVPGIITAVQKTVLPTDSVIVDAVLGQGEALDVYGKALQEQKIRAQELANIKVENALQLVEDLDEPKVELYERVFGICCDSTKCCCGTTSSSGGA